MNKMIKPLAILLLIALLLAGCGEKSVFGVSSEEDNTISVTAVKAGKDSRGIGYLTVGENESMVVAANFENGGKLRVRIFEGLLGSEEFGDEPVAEATVSGQDTAEFTIEPGEYTLAVIADTALTGTAMLSVHAAG